MEAKGTKKALPAHQATKALNPTGAAEKPPQTLNHILANMKSKIKIIDWGMLGIFALWVVSTDFDHMTPLSWFAGAVVLAYLIWYAVRRWRTK